MNEREKKVCQNSIKRVLGNALQRLGEESDGVPKTTPVRIVSSDDLMKQLDDTEVTEDLLRQKKNKLQRYTQRIKNLESAGKRPDPVVYEYIKVLRRHVSLIRSSLSRQKKTGQMETLKKVLGLE